MGGSDCQSAEHFVGTAATATATAETKMTKFWRKQGTAAAAAHTYCCVLCPVFGPDAAN